METRQNRIACCIDEDATNHVGIASPIPLPDFGARYGVASTGIIENPVRRSQKRHCRLQKRDTERIARAP